MKKARRTPILRQIMKESMLRKYDFRFTFKWVLEPFGHKGTCCKVYVLNQVSDTVWLDARAFNRCAPDEGVVQRYWCVCSFYGVEDYGPSSDSEVNFEVYTNPNNGQMTLQFEHLTGKIDVKVYDKMGNLMDNIQVYNDMVSSTIQYNMMGCPVGVYFFVATGDEGTVSKKVVIE